jgi:hypothetical protein
MLDLNHTDADAAYHNWLEQERVDHSPDIERAFRAAWAILSRFIAGPEQSAVDWFVVAEAVRDGCDDGELAGPKDLEREFQNHDLLVIHLKTAAPSPTTDCKNEGAKVDADGACLVCPSEAGEICQRPQPQAERAPGIDPKTGCYSTTQMLMDEMTGGDTSQPLFD